MLEFITTYWLEVLFSSVCAGIALLVKRLYKKQKAIENGVQALLRNELIRRYREYEIKGEITIIDKENIEHMFTEYKNLGGNGTVESMYHDLMKLDTKIIKG